MEPEKLLAMIGDLEVTRRLLLEALQARDQRIADLESQLDTNDTDAPTG